ncbi:hypothetical protein NW754_008623 [Fusarium falciforme]|nr:hypothetical protein NW754_008623 [Fusarium falciforme]
MGFTSLLTHLLAVGISTTAALDGPVVPARPTKTTLTVDCLWCTGTEVFDTSFTTSIEEHFSFPGFPPEVSKTTEKWHVQGFPVYAVGSVNLVCHDIRRHPYSFARDIVLDDSFDFVLDKFRDDDFLGMGYAIEFECLGNTPRGANMDSRNSYWNSYLESSKFLPLLPGDG